MVDTAWLTVGSRSRRDFVLAPGGDATAAARALDRLDEATDTAVPHPPEWLRFLHRFRFVVLGVVIVVTAAVAMAAGAESVPGTLLGSAVVGSFLWWLLFLLINTVMNARSRRSHVEALLRVSAEVSGVVRNLDTRDAERVRAVLNADPSLTGRLHELAWEAGMYSGHPTSSDAEHNIFRLWVDVAGGTDDKP